MKTIIIGAGSDLGVHIDGTKLGPVQLLKDVNDFYKDETVLLMQDEEYIKSKHLGDRRKNEYEIEKFNKKLYETDLKYQEEGYFPIVIGGDHSIAIPTALASSKKHENIGMIWIDAHTDYNTFQSTESGNIHGLPCAAINGYKCEELRSYHDGKVIQPSKTVIIGARSIDKEEKENLRYAGVTVFSTEDIHEKGIEQIMEEAFKIANFKTYGVHISFDLDIIDPEFAPGVSTPVEEGITAEEAIQINEMLIKHRKEIVSFDLVEFNPLRDIERKTEQIAVNILAQIIESAKSKDEHDNDKPLY